MKKIIFPILVVLFSATVISFTVMNQKPQATVNKETKILISTNYGDIKLKLYNETPQHRDNFIKLAEEGFYNGSIFHRVINQFMIQGGGAPAGKTEVNYTIPFEYVSKCFHKKGALAAARMGDNVNPEKASSGSQFYIVQGKVFTEEELEMFSTHSGINFSEEAKKAYMTIGGTPHLDQGYTVFGEVIEGLDVVDKIAAVQTGPGDKPLKDVTMTVRILE